MGSRGSGGHSRSGPSKTDMAGLPDTTEDCTPPPGMTAEARAYWDYYAPVQARKGLLTTSGRFLLRRYCQISAYFDRVMQAADEAAVLILSTVIDGAGNERPRIDNNPAGARLIALSQQMHTLESDLCLSPAAALRVPARPETEKDELEQWAAKKLRAVK